MPDEEDLYIVSIDGDFASVANEEKIKDYLYGEWKEKKNSEAKLYKNLGLFFEDKYPGIKLADELKRQIIVQDLATSGNFMNTHRQIAKLSVFEEFTDEEARDIFDSAQSNTQIYWLGEDSDVNEFIRSLVSAKGVLLDDTEKERLASLYPEPEPDLPDFEDLPF